MKHILLITLISMGFTVGVAAKTEHHKNDTEVMSDKQIKKMDRKQNIKKAKRRDFRSQKEFQHKTKRKHPKHPKHLDKYGKSNYRYHYDRHIDRDPYRMNRQRGYRYPKKGWTLAYRYDRASFYDNEGYYYGYFNRHGYFFEDVFYRYDRYYTYRDRVKGRGLFDHRYYMPANHRYYGFCR